MNFKPRNHSSVRESSSKPSTNSENILVSLMKQVNLNSKLKDEILHFAKSGQSLPYVPKEAVTASRTEEFFEPTTKTLLKFPEKPIQRLRFKIVESGSYEREPYRPNPSKTRQPREKERLQNLMSFGKDIDVEKRKESVKAREPTPTEISPSEMFDEIVGELKERRDFLNYMRQLGLEKKYLPEIQFQISRRLRELEKLDRDKAYEVGLEYGI